MRICVSVYFLKKSQPKGRPGPPAGSRVGFPIHAKPRVLGVHLQRDFVPLDSSFANEVVANELISLHDFHDGHFPSFLQVLCYSGNLQFLLLFLQFNHIIELLSGL